MGSKARSFAILLSFFCLLAASASAEEAQDASSPESPLFLVNRSNRLAYEYMPETLVLPETLIAKGKEEYVYLRPEAAKALEALFDEALAQGHTLYAVSGYRSYALQKSIFQRKVNEVGERRAARTVAPPGASEHQLGLAMDINGESTLAKGLSSAFGESPEGQWVTKNAHQFGFIIRYAKDTTEITGYAWEPWHLRFVGAEAAKEIHQLGITFEEYHQLLQERNASAWQEPPRRGGD